MTFTRFLANEDGNLSLVLALAALPLCMIAGAAIDYSRIGSTRTAMQNALDSAVLASAAIEGGLDEASAKSFLKANSEFSGVNIAHVDIRKDDSGQVVGTLKADIAMGLANLMGSSRRSILLVSKAVGTFPEKITEATFQIISAKGAYDKDIYFFTKDKDGKVLKETLVLQYDYTYSSGKGTAKFTPAKTSAMTISVGPYETYGQRVVVYQDTSYVGKHINPVSFSSDDAKASTWTKSQGDCTDKQTQSWEDGGDKDFIDFVFTMTCETSKSGKAVVRLTD